MCLSGIRILRVVSWASDHGCSDPIEATDQDLRKLAREHAGRPGGLYLWEGEKHEIYIDISNDSVTKRLRRHLIDYDFANIQHVRYLEHPGDREEPRDIEREHIWDALWTWQFTVFNSEHASSTYGDSDFDKLINVDDQLVWFDDPASTNANSDHAFRAIGGSERGGGTREVS